MADRTVIVLSDTGAEAGTASNPIHITGVAGTATAALPVNVSTITAQNPATSVTLSNVSSTVGSISLLAANANRKRALFFNDSTQDLFLKFGAGASATSFTIKMSGNSYFEMPSPVYTGVFEGSWLLAVGNARITEIT